MADKTVNVLVIEDNDVDVEAIRRGFRKHKIANPIQVARDGVEALQMLRSPTGVERPFLILLDLNMPRMNGIEFLRALREDPDLRDAIVFVLTTSKSEEDKIASYGFNVAGYMVKEDVGVGFLNLVEMLDHYWRVIEFPPDQH